MWLFDLFFSQFCKSDMSSYGYLKVFQRVSWIWNNESRLKLEWERQENDPCAICRQWSPRSACLLDTVAEVLIRWQGYMGWSGHLLFTQYAIRTLFLNYASYTMMIRIWYFLSLSTQKSFLISRQQKNNNKSLYANVCCTVTSWILSPVEFGCWASWSTVEKASHSFEYHEIPQQRPYTDACQVSAKTNIAWRSCTKCYYYMSGRAKTDSYSCFVCVEILRHSQTQWGHVQRGQFT